MAKRKRNKKLTVAELKSYIEGATELNPDDWAPNKEQWDQIVEMIMNVKQPEPVVLPHSSPPIHANQGTGQAPAHVQQPSTMNSTLEGDQEFERIDPANRPPSIDASANPAARPHVEMVADGAGMKDENGVVKSGIKIKTPNVDTSEGKPYQSGFN